MTGPSDAALRAIAHPARRAMLRLVWDNERQASELAAAAGLTRPAASQHLKQLREAGLMTVRVDANRRLYRADMAQMAQLASFLDDFWAAPLQRLKAAAESNTTAETRRVVRLVVQELTIAADTDVVYRLLTDPAEFVRWMADEAVLDPKPGGVIRWTHANGDTCSGKFVELVPGRRVVFSYGWERREVGIPPASTTVEIDLHPTDDGHTRLRLVHHGLNDPMADAHHGGWRHYLDRLSRYATGDDPGPDPLATTRVPTPAELRTQR